MRLSIALPGVTGTAAAVAKKTTNRSDRTAGLSDDDIAMFRSAWRFLAKFVKS